MEKSFTRRRNNILGNLVSFLRKCMISVLSSGSMPNHIAFIMDGNRRFARKRNLQGVSGHKFGLMALMSMLKYGHELGIKYLTFFAFGIDNFRRRKEDVQSLMELLQEALEGFMMEENMVNRYGIRVYFTGDLKLLNEPVRLAAERAMHSTAKNSTIILTICVAYSSSYEIIHAVQEFCEGKRKENGVLDVSGAGSCLNEDEREEQLQQLVKVADIEKHMYMVLVPDPDILIRTSGETRLSNFLLWQSSSTYLYSPSVLWPEIGFRHLFWAILNFQRNQLYLDKKRKQF